MMPVGGPAQSVRRDLKEVSRHELEVCLVFLLPLAALLSAILLFLPLRMPRCVFAQVLGVPCLTCGMTRAGEALLHGQVLAAFLLNPLSVLLPIGGALLWLHAVLVLAGRRRPLRLADLSARQTAVLRGALVLGGVGLWIYLIATLSV